MIYVAYCLAALWSAGCVGLPLAIGGILVTSRGDRAIGVAVLLILLPLGCLLATLPWAFIAESQSPDLATLKRGEWVCSRSHPAPTTVYIRSGSVFIPYTTTEQVCDQYTRLASDD